MRLFVVILSLCMVACSSAKNVSVRSIEKIKPQNGVVLVSATRTYKFSILGNVKPGNLVAHFRFVDVANGAAFEILSEGLLVKNSRIASVSRGSDQMNSIAEEDNASGEEQAGQILALQIPAGKYRLESWRLTADLGVNIGNVQSDPAQLPQVNFKVEPGKVTYIGNFHLQVVRDGRFLGLAMPSDAKLVCEDKAERDIMALRDNRQDIGHLRVLNQRCSLN